MMAQLTFPEYTLPGQLIADLQRQNPAWSGQPLRVLPQFKRWPFKKLLNRLQDPIAPILVIRGPRQIGKTTLQEQVIAEFLRSGMSPTRILRVQFDDLPSLKSIPAKDEPILRIVEWFERAILGKHLNAAAHEGKPAYLFLDEVQNLPAWDVQLKSLVDHASVRVLVTGSSALRIEMGKDSLAGRIQSIPVGPLRLSEIAALRGLGPLEPLQPDNGLEDWLRPDFWRELHAHGVGARAVRDAAFRCFSERGAYPFAHRQAEVPWHEIAEHLTETVVRRVIQHDLRISERGRKPAQPVLEELFRLGCRYIGQSPAPATLADEARRALSANIGPLTIRHYLDLFDASLLLRTINPLEIRLKRRKGYAKLYLSDHAIRAAWLQEIIPLDPEQLDQSPHLSVLAGRIADSVTGYFFSSLGGVEIAHLPERGNEPEVDYILTVGDKRIPVEVKYQRQIDPYRDTTGIRAYLEKSVNNAIFGLLITRDDQATVDDPRIICLPLKSLLLVR